MMLRELLSSRWFQGGLVFFLLSVGGSLLYSWHVKSTTESDMARHDQFLETDSSGSVFTTASLSYTFPSNASGNYVITAYVYKEGTN